MDVLLGQGISHYKIARKLGSGVMAVAYEAEDTRLRRRVALTFLPPEMALDAQLLESARGAGRVRLNHPNIFTLHAFELHQHFIVMELLEGQTLAP